jgi:hypothetical protein
LNEKKILLCKFESSCHFEDVIKLCILGVGNLPALLVATIASITKMTMVKLCDLFPSVL